MARRHRKKRTDCPNCGTELRKEFEFCPHCGQENHDLRVPFKTFLYEFVENITHFDTKLWNTLKAIFSKPGLLTKDHVEGKRARYVNPARFYIFTSFIFFALLTLRLDRGFARMEALDDGAITLQPRLARVDVAIGAAKAREINWATVFDEDFAALIPIDRPEYRRTIERWKADPEQMLDTLLATAGDTLPGAREALRSALDVLPDADSLDVPYTTLINGFQTSFSHRHEEVPFRKGDMTNADVDRLLGEQKDSVNWVYKRVIRAVGRVNIQSARGKQLLAHAMMKAVSVVMFILMPFTALLLLWIFFRQRYYWEHLVFAVHIHTVFFLFGIIALLVSLMMPEDLGGPIGLIPVVMCAAYLLWSLKHVYGRSWAATIARCIAMSVPYLLVFMVLLAIGAVWGLISV